MTATAVDISEPLTGTEFEWWQTRPDILPHVAITHCKAVYYHSCPWDEHPFSDETFRHNNGRGAAFIRQWALWKWTERRDGSGLWWPTGRSNEGEYDLATQLFDPGALYPSFHSEAAAITHMLAVARKRLATVEQTVMRYNEAITRLDFMLARDAAVTPGVRSDS